MALSFFNIRKSIFGRQLGITSTGGLAMAVPTTKPTLGGSSDVSLVAQMWGPGMLNTATSTNATINNYGVTRVSSAAAAPLALTVLAPAAGVQKEIYLTTTSSGTLNTTSTLIKFVGSLSGGSTILSFLSTGTVGQLIMRGMSTTEWAVTAKTANISS